MRINETRLLKDIQGFENQLSEQITIVQTFRYAIEDGDETDKSKIYTFKKEQEKKLNKTFNYVDNYEDFIHDLEATVQTHSISGSFTNQFREVKPKIDHVLMS